MVKSLYQHSLGLEIRVPMIDCYVPIFLPPVVMGSEFWTEQIFKPSLWYVRKINESTCHGEVSHQFLTNMSISGNCWKYRQVSPIERYCPTWFSKFQYHQKYIFPCSRFLCITSVKIWIFTVTARLLTSFPSCFLKTAYQSSRLCLKHAS